MPPKKPIDRSYLTQTADDEDLEVKPQDKEHQVPVVAKDAGANIYGALQGVDARRHVSKVVDIKEVRPDLAQGRRIVPSTVRGNWSGTASDIAELFTRWVAAASEERQAEINLGPYIESQEDILYPQSMGPIERSLMAIVKMAADIFRAGGVTNAPTVAGIPGNYVLETGEMRWFSFQILFLYTGESRWSKMPVVIVAEIDVWKQASENSVRNNLNAIERSRTLARLIMSLYPGNSFHPFDPLHDPCDRWYYAQVQDGNAFPIPRGKSGQVMTAMGFTDSSDLRHYRALLRLPDEVWTVADDNDWSEIRIREMVQAADGNDRVLIEMALSEAGNRQGQTVDVPDHAAQEQGDSSNGKSPSKPPKQTPPTDLFIDKTAFKGFRKLAKLSPGALKETKPQARANFLQDIQRVRAWLDTLESALHQSD
jgi:hypothetical protein